MYNHRHAVYPTTVSGHCSSIDHKDSQCLPKLWPRPQTAGSRGAISYTWTDTATVTTKYQLSTPDPARFSAGSCTRQLFRSLRYDGVRQLRTYGTVQRTPVRHSSNSRSTTTWEAAGLIWEHRHKYRRKPQARRRLWLTRAEQCALSTEYGSQ